MAVVNYSGGRNRNRPRRLMRFMTPCWRSSAPPDSKTSRHTKLRIVWLRLHYRTADQSERDKDSTTNYTSLFILWSRKLRLYPARYCSRFCNKLHFPNRDAVKVTSALAHAFLKRASTNAASSFLPCAFKAWIRPNSAQPF